MTDQENEAGLGVPIFLILFFTYFGFATAIAVDELVLKANFIHSHSPEWFIDAVRIAYWPIVKFVELIS